MALPPPTLPLIGVRIKNSAGNWYLNDRPNSGSATGVGMADNVKYTTVMPGGFDSAEFRVAGAEFASKSAFYSYGAQVTLFISEGFQGGGFDTSTPPQPKTILWDGYMKQPTSNADGTYTIKAYGWKGIVEERSQPILWQDADTSEWAEGGSSPFDHGGYKPNDAINVNVTKGAINFGIPKGQDVIGQADDSHANYTDARAFWFYDGIKPQRIAFDLDNDKMPTNRTNTPQYNIGLQKASGPNQDVSAFKNINSYQGSLATKGVNSRQELINGDNTDMIIFHFWRSGNSENATTTAFRVTVKNIVVNGDGFRNANSYAAGNANWDSYTASEVVKDIADRLGVLPVTNSKGRIQSTNPNVMPLFWTQGPWDQLIDHLAHSHGMKWAFWEDGAIEFRDWSTGVTNWVVNAYTSAATVEADLAPSDDVYHYIDVSYKLKGHKQVRHFKGGKYPTGVTPPANGPFRAKTFRAHIKEPLSMPQLSNRNTPQIVEDVAALLAAEWNTEKYSGTVKLSYALLSTVETSAVRIRAGDTLTISDFPGGSKTVRVYGTEYGDGEAMTLTVGTKPMNLPHALRKRHIEYKSKGELH